MRNLIRAWIARLDPFAARHRFLQLPAGVQLFQNEMSAAFVEMNYFDLQTHVELEDLPQGGR
jgi:hypothetical protein